MEASVSEEMDEADEMIIDLLRRQNEKLASIRRWVTFLGVLAIIGLALAVLGSCDAFLSAF